MTLEQFEDDLRHWESLGVLSHARTNNWCKHIHAAITERDALRAEVERLRASQQWQPIETGPRDGTDVLVCGGTYSVGLHSDIPLRSAVIAFWDHSHWHGPEANAHDEWWECHPTHWMPLLAPPAERGEG